MNPDPIESPADEPPDPATPARRLELARTMLVWAIHDYEVASLRWSAVHESYPRLPVPAGWPRDLDEHRAWMRLLKEADENFDAAELILAQRIQVLYDDMAPPGLRAADDPGEYFVPRAVRHGGSVYVLAFDVNRCEPGRNIIAVYREPMVIDLDAAPERVDADVA